MKLKGEKMKQEDFEREEDRVRVPELENNLIPVGIIMMNKSSEDDSISFNLKSKNKGANMNPFIITETPLEIFEVCNRRIIQFSNLVNLSLDSPEQSRIFLLQLSQELFNPRCVNVHIESHHLLNSSKVIGLPIGSFLAFSNSLTNSSFSGNSSIGYQSILSQNF